jgi:pyruvate/2-oxoglutarate dehydrogenase complex dihydrolipoamide acyltransferase (E2) component
MRRLARQLGVDLARVAPHLPGGRLTAEDMVVARGSASPAVGPIVSSPRARRAARQHGVALETVRGGGTGGRIRERDVLAALHVAPAATNGDPTGPTMPVSHIRRMIARHMVRRREQTVPVTLTAWADATGLLAAREARKSADGAEAATFNDMLLKCLAAAIRQHPQIAARWEETHLVLPGDSIDIGLAVDAPAGLVVPVVRDLEAASLAGVAAQTRDLVARAGRRRGSSTISREASPRSIRRPSAREMAATRAAFVRQTAVAALEAAGPTPLASVRPLPSNVFAQWTRMLRNCQGSVGSTSSGYSPGRPWSGVQSV